ncbi:MAG: hypothetical protein PVI06_16180 [Desulfobacterales bacterium]|jgi:hypothetical protein
MDILSGNISALVFRQVVKDGRGDFSIDSQLLRVFLAFDGTKTLDKVAIETNVDMGAMHEIVSRLLALELIEPAHKEKLTLDQEFMGYLTDQLSRALGPIAGVLIEEVISEMGYTLTQFPSSQAAELTDVLAREIQRDEKKNTFKVNMVNKIREKGY